MHASPRRGVPRDRTDETVLAAQHLDGGEVIPAADQRRVGAVGFHRQLMAARTEMSGPGLDAVVGAAAGITDGRAGADRPQIRRTAVSDAAWCTAIPRHIGAAGDGCWQGLTGGTPFPHLPPLADADTTSHLAPMTGREAEIYATAERECAATSLAALARGLATRSRDPVVVARAYAEDRFPENQGPAVAGCTKALDPSPDGPGVPAP